MPIASSIRDVFGHFQNLNLLVLLQDLSAGHTAHQSWSSSGSLCPVAHGLPAGQQVRELNILGQSADLEQGCEYAARHLGARPGAILRFICSWDDGAVGRDWLHWQLQALWEERLIDAMAMQRVLVPAVKMASHSDRLKPLHRATMA
jgi:hypothetical protein